MRICSGKDGRSENESNQALISVAKSALRNRCREKGKRWSQSAPLREIVLNEDSSLLCLVSTQLIANQLVCFRVGVHLLSMRGALGALSGDVWILSWVRSACGGILSDYDS